MPHKKPNLPEKLCVVCGRPFQWRKKWAKVWDEVKYCSDKCRKRALEQRWMCGAFGRYRRFYASDDYAVRGDLERQE